MSIVERALHKVQEAATKRPESSRPQSQPVGVADAGAATAPRLAPALVPATMIPIDRKRLAAYGIVPGESAWRTTNEFRRLKWPLLDAAVGRDGKMRCGPLLLVTSSVPGEGKTFVAINLALSIAAELDSVTLLVDGDLAKPHLSDIFGLSSRRGLTDLLADPSLQPSDVIVGTDIPGLRILPAGSAHSHAPELLASSRMEQINAWIAQAYAGSLVVFDSPPLLATNEAQVLSRYAGQVLLVVRADHTLRPMVEEAVALIDKEKRLVATLNQASTARMGNYYGAYYGRQKSPASRPHS